MKNEPKNNLRTICRDGATARRANYELRTKGFSLVELLAVIGIIVLLVAMGMPAIKAMNESFGKSGAEQIVSAALASGRAIAAKNQKYAGVRFQKAYHPDGPLEADQYMIFIIQDPNIMAYGFKAVEGRKPIKLPDSVGVMDYAIVTSRHCTDATITTESRLDDILLTDNQKDDLINENLEITDTTSFSIIFSPSGKLVIHNVRVRNKDGVYQPDNSDIDPLKHSYDDIFNSFDNIVNLGTGTFVQDDYFGCFGSPDLGLGHEPSRRSFVVYERKKFKAIDVNYRWSDYLVNLLPIYINPYTGTIIE